MLLAKPPPVPSPEVMRALAVLQDHQRTKYMIDLTDRANLIEVVALLVDAMRRSDPDYTAAHGCKQCTDEDWDTAIQAGEDVLEAAEVEY